MRRALRLFVSPRVTVVLLCVLAIFLLLNVALPQAVIVGDERLTEIALEKPLLGFALRDLGFGRMATSPIFLALLMLFFLNLAAVMLARAGSTWRRMRLQPRSAEALERWTHQPGHLQAPLPCGWNVAMLVRALRGHGYQPRRAGESAHWGVKHRTAPLGFQLFHLSFFLLCAGGLLIYLTRFDGYVVLTEGQRFNGDYVSVNRRPQWGGAPEINLELMEVQPVFRGGQPLHLGARFRVAQPGGSTELEARINHPARWGSSILLVAQAGLAPVLWLQDGAGFTLDRVGAPVRTRGGQPTELPLDEGRLRLLIHPLEEHVFPQRDELAHTRLRMELHRSHTRLGAGELAPGEALNAGDLRLLLLELRYWVGFRVISEHGGGLLIAAYLVGVVGLVWRLLMYRREVAVTWDAATLRLAGRSEYFSRRFEQELAAVMATLTAETTWARRPAVDQED